MRIEYLSNHPLKMKEDAKAHYEQATLQEAQKYAELMKAQNRLQQVLKDKRWWQKILPVPTVAEQAAKMRMLEAKFEREDAQDKQRRLAGEMKAWTAGVEGEQAFDQAVAVLSDDWMLFSGYRNRAGEADKVLLGPDGLWVVEVKNVNAWIYVSGSDWIYERLDANGEPVRTKAQDNAGRTWGRQVLNVAEGLDDHLQRNGMMVTIRTAVVLTHPEALVLQNRNAEVDVVGRPQVLLHAIKKFALPMTTESSLSVAELIRRDHQRHSRLV